MLPETLLSQLALDHDVITDATADAGADLVLRVPGWPPTAYAVRVFDKGLTPSAVAREAQRLSVTSSIGCLFVVPSASVRTFDVAVEIGVSILVAPRAAVPHTLGVLVGHDGRILHLQAPVVDAFEELTPKRRRGRVPWATYALAFTLLDDMHTVRTQAELASAHGISQARASQILKQLNGVAGDDKGHLDPVRLSNWLVTNYQSRPRAATTWATLDTPVQAAQKVQEHLTKQSSPHLLSGEVAADHCVPWSRPRSVWIWSRTLADLTHIGATPVAQPGENTITIAVPDDPYLLNSPLKDHPDLALLAPWRLWVDLMHQQHLEAAAALRDALLRAFYPPQH